MQRPTRLRRKRRPRALRRLEPEVERIAIVVAVVLLAGVLSFVMRRRRPDAPTQPTWMVPAQVDRNDFVDPTAPWLVAVFTSSTCGTCAGVFEKAKALSSEVVAVDDVEFGARRAEHLRYGIDAVPSVIVADRDGVVRASFVGPVTAADLWAAVAEVRDAK